MKPKVKEKEAGCLACSARKRRYVTRYVLSECENCPWVKGRRNPCGVDADPVQRGTLETKGHYNKEKRRRKRSGSH